MRELTQTICLVFTLLFLPQLERNYFELVLAFFTVCFRALLEQKIILAVCSFCYRAISIILYFTEIYIGMCMYFCS